MRLSIPFRRPRHIFYGWWLVGLTWLIMGVVVGPVFQGLGVFFVALERQFAWSRTSLSIAFSLGRVEGALFGPIEGVMTDRFGSRRMVLIGLLTLGVGLIVFSFIQNLIGFYAAFLIIFLGAGLAAFIPMMSALNNWFRRQRTTAIALGMMGATLGGVLVPALAFLVDSFGWRATARVLGLAVLLLAVPLGKAVRNRPEEYGLHPDGDALPNSSTSEPLPIEPSQQADGPDFTLAQAVRTPAFWAISITHGLGATVFVTIIIHLVPALTDAGLSLQLAGTVVAILALAASISQVVGGFLGDRIPKRPLIFGALIVQGTGMVIGATADTMAQAALFAVVFGIGQGVRVPLLVSIRGDYFGRRYFATILGVSQLPMNLLMLGAPILVGYLFDTLGSYTVAFLGLAAVNYSGAALMLMVRKPELPVSQGQIRSEGQSPISPAR